MSTGSVYPSIAAMLQSNPHGALTALDQLVGPDRDSREAWDLRGRALFHLGRQHEAYGDAATALTCWEQALRCNDVSIQGQLGAAIEELCRREATALSQAGRSPEAIALVDRGLALFRSGRLASLRDQLATPLGRAAVAAAAAAAAPARPVVPAAVPTAPPATSARRDSVGRTASTVAFNALPAASRRRFVDCVSGRATPAPLNVETSGSAAARVFGLLLATAALVVFGSLGFAEVGGSSYDPPATLVGYALALFFMALAVAGIVRARIVRSSLPYAPGTYLFPADIVVADAAGSLRILPLRELKSFKCVHHSTNGRYTHSMLHFQFEKVFHACRLPSQARAEAALQRLSEAERTQGAAARRGDVATIEALDPLAGARVDADPASAPMARPAPGWLRWRALLALAAGVLLAGPVWVARNAVSDYLLFAAAQRQRTEAAYRQYTTQGWLFVARARQQMPFVAFAEAKEKGGSVTALRAILRDYPGSPVEADVRRAVEAAYEKSRAKFRAQAAGADPRMVAFMEKLVDFMERHDFSAVAVRFRAPNPAALAAADARLRARAAAIARTMAPIAPHFADKTAQLREAAIVEQLNKGFGTIFPADVLALNMGPRLPATGGAPTDAPAIFIDYDVVPSGSTYQSETDVFGKLFVGIKVTFKVAMAVPGTPQPFEFGLEVQPPSHFTVHYEKASAALAAFDGAPDERVYAVMAERAFDELETKLRAAFFPTLAAASAPAAVRVKPAR